MFTAVNDKIAHPKNPGSHDKISNKNKKRRKTWMKLTKY
jgi:hypothetical protein